MRQADARLMEPAWLAGHAAGIGRNARAALRAEPLLAAAVRQLALVETPDNPARGMPRLRLDEQITRRDVATQLQLIDAAARMGDVVEALRHYDRALLVAPDLAPKLFPILSRAMSEPEIWTALRKYAARPWFNLLLGASLGNGAEPSSVIRLAAYARPSEVPGEDNTSKQALCTQLLRQLVAGGDYAEARDFARSLPGSAHAVLGDIGVNAATTDARLAPLGWELSNDDAVETSLVNGEGLDVRIAPARSALAATRVTLLPAGEYDLAFDLIYAEGVTHAALSWDVQCLSGGTIWHQPMPSLAGRVTFHAQFVVPAGCEAQSWHLNASADEGQFVSTARLTRLSLVRR
jgi:hypothetical protein